MSQKNEYSIWARKVGAVFSVNPRFGYRNEMLWIKRDPSERQFAEAYERPSMHVCVDGATGSGKSSLVRTYLENNKVQYALVQVTKEMHWADLCKEILQKPQNWHTSFNVEFEGGLKGYEPQVGFRIGFGTQIDDLDDLELLEKTSRIWTEHDVAREMVRQKASLMVDDFENASPELVNRISDLAKILTQSYLHPNGKVIVVGTGDIYLRLLKQNSSLRDRISQVTLGSLPSVGLSWKFLMEGFERLKLKHPGNSIYPNEREKRINCAKAIFDAADGFPKSLNKLGQEIALKAIGRSAVSASDIIGQANEMLIRNWYECRALKPEWLNLIKENRSAREVFKHLCTTKGIGAVYNTTSILDSLQRINRNVYEAIDLLIEIGFLTKTGLSADVVFVADPSIAHTISVVISNPGQFEGGVQLAELSSQLSLPLYEDKWDDVKPD